MNRLVPWHGSRIRLAVSGGKSFTRRVNSSLPVRPHRPARLHKRIRRSYADTRDPRAPFHAISAVSRALLEKGRLDGDTATRIVLENLERHDQERIRRAA